MILEKNQLIPQIDDMKGIRKAFGKNGMKIDKLLGHKSILKLFQAIIATCVNLTVTGVYSLEHYLAPLVYACSRRCTVTQAFKALPGTPSRRSFERNVLSHLFFNQVQKGINKLLLTFARVLKPFLRGHLTLAMDYTKVPFYGDRERAPETRRGKATQGTCNFYAYATIYLMFNKIRFTLAVVMMNGQQPLDETVAALLDRIAPLKLKIKTVLMDREYHNGKVFAQLVKRNIPFLCAARKTSRVKEYCKNRKRRKVLFDVKMRNEWLHCDLYVVVTYKKGNRGKHGVDYFTYLAWGREYSLRGVKKLYRERFGVETSYRVVKGVMARCASVDPGLRMLLMGISFALANYVVYLKYEYASPPMKDGEVSRKPRDGILDNFEVNELIQNALRDIYNCLREVETLNSVPVDFVSFHLKQWRNAIKTLFGGLLV